MARTWSLVLIERRVYGPYLAELSKMLPRPSLSLGSAPVAPENQPWHREPAAIFAAGAAGLVLLIALVVTVVELSDDWSQPSTTVYTTQATTTEQTLRSTEPFVITPNSSTSYPSGAPLSTTEIGLPDQSTTSGTDTTSDTPIVTTDPRYPGTHPVTTSPSPNAGQSTTTRNRNRYNETRILTPG
jgi:hypothetical protein